MKQTPPRAPATSSVERIPTEARPGNGVTRLTGTERPAPPTATPADMADPQARVIRTG